MAGAASGLTGAAGGLTGAEPCVVQDYPDAESFLEAISSLWHKEWQRVYSADRAASIPFQDGDVNYGVVHSPAMKLLCLLTTGACQGQERGI